MKWENTYISGLGSWVPESHSAARAVADGLYDQELLDADGFEGAAVEPQLVAPEMAVEAARRALRGASVDPGSVDLVFHSWIWFQGVDMWPPASYIAAHAAHPSARAFDLQQQCNAAVGGLELAASLLPTVDGSILLTAADRFTGDQIDRWRTEPNVVYGDGAGAVVLTRTPGLLRVVSSHTEAANELEAVVRGPVFAEGPTAELISIGDRFEHFLSTGGMREAAGRLISAVTTSVRRALEDADASLEDMARVVIPAVGRSKLDWQLQSLIPVELAKTNWRFAAAMGHLGAADQFVGLERMVAEGGLEIGDRVLVVGGGAGMTCTSLVLEYLGGSAAEDAEERVAVAAV